MNKKSFSTTDYHLSCLVENLFTIEFISAKSDCPLAIVARRDTSTGSSSSSHKKLSSSHKFDKDNRASMDSVFALKRTNSNVSTND